MSIGIDQGNAVPIGYFTDMSVEMTQRLSAVMSIHVAHARLADDQVEEAVAAPGRRAIRAEAAA